MRIGVMMGAGADDSIAKLIAMAKDIEALGLDNIWMANIFSFDAITALAVIGAAVPRIGLGTAVTPTYPRHPTAIAQQALTAAAATDNRFTLGIGLSHQIVIENMLGFSYAKPARHMREYLSVLMPLLGEQRLRGEPTTFHGEQYNVNGINLQVPGAKHVPVVLAALGPVMLKLAGEMADGTSTWMVGPKTMAKHIKPSLANAARAAGRAEPTIVGGFPIVLTNKPDEARAMINEMLVIYGQLPSYRAMLDREGVKGPADVAIVGDENYLRGAIKRIADIGVTDFNASIVPTEAGAYERTLEFLASMK